MRAVWLLSCLLLFACTQSGPSSNAETPLTLMTRVAKLAQQCWFKGKDPAFSAFKLANELDSYSGRPRILIVPKNNPAGLPKLVAEARRESSRNRFSTFGPLLSGPQGSRIEKQLNGWAGGARTC